MARPKTVQPETNSVSIRNLLIVGGIGLAVRMLAFCTFNRAILTGNEDTYWYYAHAFIFGDPNHTGILPGWPWVLKVLISLWDSTDFARFFVVLLGTLNGIFVAFLGEKQFGRKVGLTAGLLFAVYPEEVVMSHGLYVETFVETLVLGLTVLVFRNLSMMTDSRFLGLTGFLFGLAMLTKHFLILPFAAIFVVLWAHSLISWKKTSVLLVSFAVPLLLFSFVVSRAGQDPLTMLISPLKSMEEWQANHAIHWPGYQRTFSPLNSGRFLLPWREFWARAEINFLHLWGCDSVPLSKIRYNFFLGPPFLTRPLIWVFVLFHLGLLFLGGLGILTARSTPFRTYALAILFFLTGMVLFFYMESRYRDPFMGLLVLFAANFGWSLREGKVFSGRVKLKLAASGLLLAALVFIFVHNGLKYFRGLDMKVPEENHGPEAGG